MSQLVSPPLAVFATSACLKQKANEGMRPGAWRMEKPMHAKTTDPVELAIAALALVREQAPETRLLPIAARPVADHPEYQQVNRIGRDGTALKRGWTFLVNTATRTVLRTVGDPDDLDFEAAMQHAMPA
jgi:hypothetical protein